MVKIDNISFDEIGISDEARVEMESKAHTANFHAFNFKKMTNE